MNERVKAMPTSGLFFVRNTRNGLFVSNGYANKKTAKAIRDQLNKEGDGTDWVISYGVEHHLYAPANWENDR
jgi:hypothetical protein